VIVLGLGLLVVLLAIVGFDEAVRLGGAVIWEISLASLLAGRRAATA
jgi:hypothetical protein